MLNLENIYVEMDAKFLVYLLSNLSVENLILEPLLFDYRNLMKTFPNYTIAHVYRKAHHLWWKTCWIVIKPAIFVTGLWFFSFEYMLGYRLPAPKKKKKKNPSYDNNSYKSSRLSGWCSWLSR